jgi:hypothetical protein
MHIDKKHRSPETYRQLEDEYMPRTGHREKESMLRDSSLRLRICVFMELMSSSSLCSWVALFTTDFNWLVLCFLSPQ